MDPLSDVRRQIGLRVAEIQQRAARIARSFVELAQRIHERRARGRRRRALARHQAQGGASQDFGSGLALSQGQADVGQFNEGLDIGRHNYPVRPERRPEAEVEGRLH